jgi:hypothetical protein
VSYLFLNEHKVDLLWSNITHTKLQWRLQHLSNGGGGASGGATSFAGGSTVWPIYPANSIKSNNNIYKLTSKSQYSDFIT